MPSYNPNGIWGSKEKKYSYDPQNSAVQPQGQPQKKSEPTAGGQPMEPQKPSFYHRHKLAFFTAGLLLALALIGLVFYLLLPAAAPNITITFSRPDSITVGQPFPFSVTVSNESKSVMKNASLNIILPDGISFVGQDASQRVMAEQIDTLSSQTINPPTNLQLIATGNPGTSQTINVTLTYQTAETATTQYETDANTNVLVGQQPGITFSYNASSSIYSGQNFDLVVNYQNNSTGTAIQDLQFTMAYPPAYHFIRSTIAPTGAASNMWDLGAVAANTTGTVTITGNIIGPSGGQYKLDGTPIEHISGQAYPLTPPTSANFSVMASPLSLSILLNNSSSYVAGLADNLNYTVTYTNNSNVTFQGSNIAVSLVGQMFNFSSLKTPGSFNSNTNTITWNAANTPQLLSIAPGQSGSVNFSISTKPTFPIRLPSNINYTLNATAQIESPTVPPNTAGSDTRSITTLASKVGGLITIAAKGYAHEPTALARNSGPYPPVANQPTQYTIHWDITNYSTDAQNVTVSAYLQSGTTFTGKIESNIGSSTPSYNPSTGLISWTIPLIPATTGVIGPPIEAIFQVTNTPSITQVGQDVTLMGQTSLSGTDAFTGAALKVSSDPITTQLPDDPSITTQNREVTQ